MELTILILLLPFLSFLILGIGGKWMSHRTAGAIGTLILGAVAVLSYVTAFQYLSLIHIFPMKQWKITAEYPPRHIARRSATYLRIILFIMLLNVFIISILPDVYKRQSPLEQCL